MEVSSADGASGMVSAGVLERLGRREGDPVSGSSTLGGGVLLLGRAECWWVLVEGGYIRDGGVVMVEKVQGVKKEVSVFINVERSAGALRGVLVRELRLEAGGDC